MFDDVLARPKGNDNDLCCVVITESELNNPIAVPLDKWSNIDAERVVIAVENVLNSDENFSLDKAMQVIIPNIRFPVAAAPNP